MSLRFQQKLIIPATARPLVERPRVLAELEQVVTTRRVVALAAPAGWGKTTTLAHIWRMPPKKPFAAPGTVVNEDPYHKARLTSEFVVNAAASA